MFHRVKISPRLLVLAAATAATLQLGAESGARAADGPFQFFAVTPCRVFDTRCPQSGEAGCATAVGNNGQPILSGVTKTVAIRTRCGIPGTAKAVAFNATAVGPSGNGFLSIFPAPSWNGTSTINFQTGDIAVPNGAVVPLKILGGAETPGTTPDVGLLTSTGSVHVILDVNGYFQ